jgi:hypothetical protein
MMGTGILGSEVVEGVEVAGAVVVGVRGVVTGMGIVEEGGVMVVAAGVVGIGGVVTV